MTEIIQKDNRYQKKKPEIAQRFINLGKEEIKSKINENKAKKNKNKSKIIDISEGDNSDEVKTGSDLEDEDNKIIDKIFNKHKESRKNNFKIKRRKSISINNRKKINKHSPSLLLRESSKQNMTKKIQKNLLAKKKKRTKENKENELYLDFKELIEKGSENQKKKLRSYYNLNQDKQDVAILKSEKENHIKKVL